eukprot:TRINITY_DN6158_c0_g1_i1.p1 TRINITY_DN6158_c0_g1~~TRINITY_DN6158_c0_g1_i1.p1  ORF type:complete len:436 (+),score=98.00 TRINITY_DN6158_c0_g1_i1:3-1310(+)
MNTDFVFFGALGLLAITAIALIYAVFSLCALICGYSTKTLKMIIAVMWISIVVYFFAMVLPLKIDSTLNRLAAVEYLPVEVSQEAKDLQMSLQIADLHADSLLWPRRDLLVRNDFGHVDLPRLIEGRVAVQAFTIVTSSPAKMNFNANPEPEGFFSDMLTLKSLIENWAGLDTINSNKVRTMFQIEQLHRFEERSKGQLKIIKTKEDLSYVLDKHAKGDKIAGGFLGIEGLHALDSDWRNVEVFYNAGVRMAAFTHFFDNSLGGSAHGVVKGGMTELGEKVLSEMERLGMIVDIAHNSHSLISDLIKKVGENTVIMTSHTGVQALCGSYERNLNDEELKAIAKTGGVIGIAFFEPAVCGDDLMKSVLDSIMYVKDLVGIDYVALGSDWDGVVQTPIDASSTIYITHGLLERGLTPEEVRKVMGENVFNMLAKALP